mgnify:CR=1 FL=1
MMKFLLVVAVLLIAYLVWRSGRASERDDKPAPRAGANPALPQDMVRCPVCSLHLPRPDAVAGSSGRLYCCAEHRRDGGN